MSDHQSNASRLKEINASQRYTMWSVFRRTEIVEAGLADDALAALEPLTGGDSDLVVRGWYDVAGLRADADLMVWWHAPEYETIQQAYHTFRATALGRTLEPVWSQLAVHRPAEFNKSHVPAFMADERVRDHVCVYPFVRSYEWYLLPDEERRALLVEHGSMGRDYPDVRANTMQSFALGDFEWILAFEADEMGRIVDLMRILRASGARRHVRVEVPFYSGRRRELGEIVRSWRG
ncbi:chlorite dismutase family protein [Mariniluteicoccus endophyticus]